MTELGQNESLSPQGQARRDAMLGELVGHMSHLRRRRRIRRASLSTAMAFLVCVGVFRLAQFSPTHPSITSRPEVELDARPSVSSQATRVVYVATDPDVIRRYRASSQPIVVWVNDAQLIEVLAQMGRPAGLIRFGDRLALSAPVTDDELMLNQQNR